MNMSYPNVGSLYCDHSIPDANTFAIKAIDVKIDYYVMCHFCQLAL